MANSILSGESAQDAILNCVITVDGIAINGMHVPVSFGYMWFVVSYHRSKPLNNRFLIESQFWSQKIGLTFYNWRLAFI